MKKIKTHKYNHMKKKKHIKKIKHMDSICRSSKVPRRRSGPREDAGKQGTMYLDLNGARAGGGGRTTLGRRHVGGGRRPDDAGPRATRRSAGESPGNRFQHERPRDMPSARSPRDAGTDDENSLVRERRPRRPHLAMASGTSRANLRVEGCRMASCHFLAS